LGTLPILRTDGFSGLDVRIGGMDGPWSDSEYAKYQEEVKFDRDIIRNG
jgi:hypothetical protein